MKGRGALLGPEESGRILFGEDGLVFLGHYYINCWIFADLRVGVDVWLGPALTKLLVMVFQRVVCFPCEERSEGSGDSGSVILPVF